MRFKLDENLPLASQAALNSAGHEAITIREQGMGGCNDERIWAVCKEEGRALVTLDLGFADIRVYDFQTQPGVLVLRPQKQDVESILRTLRNAIDLLGKEPLAGKLWVAGSKGVRLK